MTEPLSDATADQIEHAIADAIHAHDFLHIQPLMVKLALLDPDRADDLLSLLKLVVKRA